MWRSRGSDRTPVQVEDTAPAELAQMHESALLDLTDRTRGAVDLIDAMLRVEQASAVRDAKFFNALLDVRNVLAPGSQVLPLRPSVPVIPGRS
jgi:hypothetical protein